MDLNGVIRALLAAGDVDGAATAVLDKLGREISGYLCALLPDDDAADAFSMFAEDLWRGLPGFRFECPVRAWAYRLAWRSAARVARDRYRRLRVRLPSSAPSRLPAPAPSQSGLSPGSRRAMLARLRGALTLDEQTLLILRVDRELEWDEVATVLSDKGQRITAAVLRKRFERLKARLATLARAQGLVE